ncbi:translocation/assembly module TamB, partial [archaeon]|nr:translocation/assembly module TamB [archaeon]
AGDLFFTADAARPIMKPVITGDITFDGVRAAILPNDQLIHGVKGHVRLSKNAVVIEDLDGRLDNGWFGLSGKIGLKDLSPVSVDLNASARSLPVAIPDRMNLTLDGQASLKGTADDTLLKGDVVIKEGTYYKDVQVNLIAEVGERITGSGKPQEAPRRPFDQAFLRGMKLDVSVTRQGTLIIENNLADAAINPDLHVRGTLNNPVITGRVSVIQGTVNYQKRSFDITKGVVDFPNPYRTDPRVDVKAQGKVRDWTITIAVSGPLNDLKIDLSSQPAAENATILSLLATGKTPDEIAGRFGESQGSPSAMLAELVANTYSEDVKRTAGIDILEFETGNPQAGSQATDIKVTVGEKLSRRLTVKYTVETSGNEITRTTVAEYRLLENLLFNGFQDSNGLFGGDVQIRLEFR